MKLIENNGGVKDEFVFDEPQKRKSSIIRLVLDFIENIEDEYAINLPDDEVNRLRKRLYKNLDSLHVSLIKQWHHEQV